MKYYFKRFVKLPILKYNSINDNKIYLSMISLWELYKLSFTNQRAYFNTIDSLKNNNEEDNIELFSIESTEEIENFSVAWFQRRTQNQRLSNIADYLITKNEDIEFFGDDENVLKSYLKNLWKDSIFPNNIIVSLNNELQYSKENFFHELLIDESNSLDLQDFNLAKDYFRNIDVLDWGKIRLENLDWEMTDNRYSQLCFIINNLLYIPEFQLDEHITKDEIEDFAKKSPLYFNTIKSVWWEGVKEYEKYYKVAWIIDGQHRTMSLRFLDSAINKLKPKIVKYLKILGKEVLIENFNSDTIKRNIYEKSIAITTYLNSTLSEQADIFLDINNNAKPVDKSLTYDLLPLTAQWITVELAAKSIFDKFNQTKESPLYKILFNIRWYKKDDGDNILSQANFINELKYYLKETKNKDRIFYKFYDNKKLTPVYWLMYSFFMKLNHAYESTVFRWWLYNDTDFALYRTTWFGATLQLMVAILKSSWENIDNYNEITHKDENNKLNLLFSEKIRILSEKIKFTRWEISNFRWKGWQDELARVMRIFIWLDDITKYIWEDKEKIMKQMGLFD